MMKAIKYNILLILCFLGINVLSQTTVLPNIIIIFCDDLGYGDLGISGSSVHRTPNIEKMANEGIYFTDFYSTSPFCAPSRASLLTGCYPRRVNMDVDEDGRCVVFPVSKKGLNPKEINIANHLKRKGYHTGLIGKWHLGDQPEFLPNNQGFDSFYGLPYSNDTDPEFGVKQKFERAFPPIPLLRDEKVIEVPIDQNTLTKRYTVEAIKFIKEHKNGPFFLYLAHTMPHKPPHASEQFKGKSMNKLYGDAVEEIDWSTGEILNTLKQLNMQDNTLVLFTSDNGASPWTTEEEGRGSNLPLRGWKGSTFEGGMRVPFIAWWPGRIKPSSISNELSTTMDFLPSIARLTQTPLPDNHKIDGKNMLPLLFGEPNANSEYDVFYYYLREQLQAVRKGKWKLHLPLEKACRGCWQYEDQFRSAALYNLDTDFSESVNLIADFPEVAEELKNLAEQARIDLGDVQRQGKYQREAGYVENPVPLIK